MKCVAPFLRLLIIFQCLGAPANANPPNTLADCAAIDDPSQRLACYDRLAERTPPPLSAPPPAAAPSSSFGLPAARPTPAFVPPPASPSPQTFGLYAAEHPSAPAPADPTLTAKVVGFGSSSNGYSTVSLEGGQVWALLDQADPVLAQGQTVTIRRGSLGSFLMTTPAKRLHPVRRLR